MSVSEHYASQLAARGFTADAAQQRAIERLQQLADEWGQFNQRRSSLLRKLFDRSSASPRGVWMWGGVGRGKSFLMDVFFEAVPVERKARLHFHEFMRGVHRELRELRQVSDPLDEVARRIAARYQLICFDEFHVSDVADAMILDRLLRALFAQGVGFVMTSNYRPDDLYPDGLNRESILPAIELLKSRLDVLGVDAGIDYRRLEMQRAHAYIVPCGPEADTQLAHTFFQAAGEAGEAQSLRIENRDIQTVRCGQAVVWCTFASLCGTARSQLDYLEIASRFHTVLLSDVPRMSAAMSSEARRFTWLVDVFYDQKVKLLISAQCPPEALYTAGAMSHEFHRTVSRLIEMQSREYLAAPLRGVAQQVT